VNLPSVVCLLPSGFCSLISSVCRLSSALSTLPLAFQFLRSLQLSFLCPLIGLSHARYHSRASCIFHGARCNLARPVCPTPGPFPDRAGSRTRHRAPPQT